MKRLLTRFIIAGAAGLAVGGWLFLRETLHLVPSAPEKRSRGPARTGARPRATHAHPAVRGRQIGASASRRLHAEEMRQRPAEGRN